MCGETFFGREQELAILADMLADQRTSILIPGPRRIGKTSLVKEFMRRSEDRHNILYFDLEGRNSVIELCQDLTTMIQRQYPQIVSKKLDLTNVWNKAAKMVPELKIAGVFSAKTGEIVPDAKKILETMEPCFALLTQHYFIFAFDEFSDFLWNLQQNSHEEAKGFLAWLRRLRQEGKLQMIATGSINILSTVEAMNLTQLINDLEEIHILPLTETEIRLLLGKLTNYINLQLAEDGIDFVMERLSDGIPFFIQLFVSELRVHRDRQRGTYDLEAIKAIYSKITDKPHKTFITLHNRLKDHVSPNEFKAATTLLAHLASDSMTFADLWPYVQDCLEDKGQLNRLIKRLVDECYLSKTEQQFHFISPCWQTGGTVTTIGRNHHES